MFARTAPTAHQGGIRQSWRKLNIPTQLHGTPARLLRWTLMTSGRIGPMSESRSQLYEKSLIHAFDGSASRCHLKRSGSGIGSMRFRTDRVPVNRRKEMPCKSHGDRRRNATGKPRAPVPPRLPSRGTRRQALVRPAARLTHPTSERKAVCSWPLALHPVRPRCSIPGSEGGVERAPVPTLQPGAAIPVRAKCLRPNLLRGNSDRLARISLQQFPRIPGASLPHVVASVQI